MPEVIFNGPAGRIEGRFHPAKERTAPIALILHLHPQFGGTMNNQIVYQMYYMFAKRGFAVLRFNFRGVGRSQGSFDHGQGELSDAASALDWVQSVHPDARACWIAGFSFGAWIGMQLLMRRPEVEGFISVAPPANLNDFSFLAPCPSSGLIIHGDSDKVVPTKGRSDARRQAQDAEGHRHRPSDGPRRQPLLRGPYRRAHRLLRRVRRPTPGRNRHRWPEPSGRQREKKKPLSRPRKGLFRTWTPGIAIPGGALHGLAEVHCGSFRCGTLPPDDGWR